MRARGRRGSTAMSFLLITVRRVVHRSIDLSEYIRAAVEGKRKETYLRSLRKEIFNLLVILKMLAAHRTMVLRLVRIGKQDAVPIIEETYGPDLLVAKPLADSADVHTVTRSIVDASLISDPNELRICRKEPDGLRRVSSGMLRKNHYAPELPQSRLNRGSQR